jgi:hypothetical protein
MSTPASGRIYSPDSLAEKQWSRLPGSSPSLPSSTPHRFSWLPPKGDSNTGAGSGNRTRIISLEGWGSTIELYPQIPSVWVTADMLSMSFANQTLAYQAFKTKKQRTKNSQQRALRPLFSVACCCQYWNYLTGGGGWI